MAFFWNGSFRFGVGLTAVGFEALHLVAAGLAAGGFKQHQVHHSNAAEPTSVTKTAECNASQTRCGRVGTEYLSADAAIYEF